MPECDCPLIAAERAYWEAAAVYHAEAALYHTNQNGTAIGNVMSCDMQWAMCDCDNQMMQAQSQDQALVPLRAHRVDAVWWERRLADRKADMDAKYEAWQKELKKDETGRPE
jgi:hypothetical protein